MILIDASRQEQGSNNGYDSLYKPNITAVPLLYNLKYTPIQVVVTSDPTGPWQILSNKTWEVGE